MVARELVRVVRLRIISDWSESLGLVVEALCWSKTAVVGLVVGGFEVVV